MKSKLLLTTAFLLCAGSAPALAADLILEETTLPPAETSLLGGFYVQVLGGVALPGVVNYSLSGDYDMDPGYAIGGTLGVGLMDGLSAELDVLHMRRTMSDYDYYHVATTSLMGNLKYTVDLNDTFSLYGAAGLGYIWIVETDDNLPATYEASDFGYQLIAGVGAQVAENVTLLAEYRFQNTFSGADTSYGEVIHTPTSAVLVGAKIGF